MSIFRRPREEGGRQEGKISPGIVDHGSEERNREKRSRFSRTGARLKRSRFRSSSPVLFLRVGLYFDGGWTPLATVHFDSRLQRGVVGEGSKGRGNYDGQIMDGVHTERVGQIHRLWNCLICPLYPSFRLYQRRWSRDWSERRSPIPRLDKERAPL